MLNTLGTYYAGIIGGSLGRGCYIRIWDCPIRVWDYPIRVWDRPIRVYENSGQSLHSYNNS